MNKKLKLQLVYLTLGVGAFVLGCMKVDEWLNTSHTYEVYASHQEIVAEATPSPGVDSTEKPIPTPAPVPRDREWIRQEIERVFGEHSDKAFLLLQGEGCAENRNLDPNAVNDNTAWGGTGKDWGVFQINDYWQGVRHEGKAIQFLTDPEINVRIAWRLYEDDNYSFKLWTCGRYHGI